MALLINVPNPDADCKSMPINIALALRACKPMDLAEWVCLDLDKIKRAIPSNKFYVSPLRSGTGNLRYGHNLKDRVSWLEDVDPLTQACRSDASKHGC